MQPSPPAGGSQTQATVSVVQFLRCLEDSRLLPELDVRKIQSSQRGSTAADARALAQELVQEKKLTRYQASVLCQGKSKGLVLGNYVILDKLGAGGMGMVFKARHRRMDRVVALKVLPPAVSQSEYAVRRFRREAEAAAKLHHPNIVAAHDADQAGGIHFLVMEYVEGSDLSRLVKTRGPLPVGQAISCILQAARGLAHAHEAGIVHRDIKPGNLLLDTKGHVKVLDMGLARIDAADNAPADDSATDELTKSGSILGTTDYMSPEQALNTKRADQRADIYSLGATLYYLLVGRPMYQGDTAMEKLLAHREQAIPKPSAVRKDLPASLEAIYSRMVEKSPTDRYQSMAEVIGDLEKCLGGSIPEVVIRSGSQRRRRWMVYGGITGGALVAVAAVLFAVTGAGRVETQGAPATAAGAGSRTSPGAPTLAGVDDAWLKSVAAMKADDQLKAVREKMIALNPGFDGELGPKIENGTVVAVNFSSRQVTNLAPLRALPHLRSVRCGGVFQGTGKLVDLGPLRGSGLAELDCSYTRVSDLGPLQGLPLEKLWLRKTEVSSLAPLHNTKLRVLDCSGTRVSDLSPLSGLPLEELQCGNSPVGDLSPLRKLPLRSLGCWWIKTQDLRPLIGMPLEELSGVPRPEDFGDLVRGLKHLKTLNSQTAADLRYALDETTPILNWQVLGPLPLEAGMPFDIPADGILPEQVFSRKYLGRDGNQVSWRPLKADVLGFADIRPSVNSATLFATASIESAAAREATLIMGGDDRIAVWINGDKAYERKETRNWALVGDRAQARLKKGTNHVLIRCDNLQGAWGFSVRVSNEKNPK
jgi:tRNA A-37 threonylcarbamoyl transferase component Bud32